MKTFEIARDSWHYRLAYHYGPFNPARNDHQNICAYLRSVFIGCLAALFFTLLVSYLVTSTVCTIGGLILWPFLHFLDLPFGLCLGGQVLLTFAAGGLLVHGFCFVVDFIQKKFMGFINTFDEKQPVEKEPGFIKLAWRSFKDKTCSKIVIK